MTGPMLEACAPHARVGRRLLRARRLRRGPGAGGAPGRSGGRSAAPDPREPARRGARASPWPARSRAASADHCTFATADDIANLRDAGVVATLLPGRRVLDPVALPGRAGHDRGRRHRRARHRLQPRLLLHVVDAAVHGARGPRDADDARPRRCGRRRPAAPRRCGATTSGTSALGARADFAVLAAPSYLHLMYRPGVPLGGRDLPRWPPARLGRRARGSGSGSGAGGRVALGRQR